MNRAELKDVDVFNTNCPVGTEIEVEGVGKLPVIVPGLCLFRAIAHVYVRLTQKVMYTHTLLSRLTILKISPRKRFVKVRISTAS